MLGKLIDSFKKLLPKNQNNIDIVKQSKPKVKLIAITHGAGDLMDTSAQEVISYIARVSNPNNQLNFDTAGGLIRYCIKNKHVSIFEHAYMTLEINTTRAIAAQILRHRSFTFQEFCMAGSTNVYFDLPASLKNNKRRLYKSTLEELYKKWTKSGYHRNRLQKMNVRIFDEKTRTFTNSHIKEVFKTGLKEIFEVNLENGKVIRCTKEHKVLTQDGFKSLEEHLGLRLIDNTAVISNNEYIGCSGVSGNTLSVKWSKVKSVKYLGQQMTYDLEVDHDSHNYVADGVVVHNSQRYMDITALSDNPIIPELRRQDNKNRQNSIDDFSEDEQLKMQKEIQHYFDTGMKLYEKLLSNGVAKECARFILPLSTSTRIYITGNVRSWITYIALREKNGTQKEHMEIAKACKQIFAEQFPTCYEALGGDEEWTI